MFCNDRQYVVAVKVQILDAQNLPNFVDNQAKIYEKKLNLSRHLIGYEKIDVISFCFLIRKNITI